jgi:hypothetical protein
MIDRGTTAALLEVELEDQALPGADASAPA